MTRWKREFRKKEKKLNVYLMKKKRHDREKIKSELKMRPDLMKKERKKSALKNRSK